jgi:predicted patatin/cPLA2 family phospholipase
MHPVLELVVARVAAANRAPAASPGAAGPGQRADGARLAPVIEGGGMRCAITGGNWFDAGVSESVPLRTALVQGATHVLVLRSRRADEQDTAESVRDAQLVGRYLRRYSPGLEAAFLDRSARLRRADAELDARERDHAGVPAVLSVRPSAGTPSVGRLERDNARAVAGLEAGHGIAHAQICPAVAGTS